MPSTRHIRRRIKAVKNTAQITKAMQMVAASKMRKAQELAVHGRPFAEQLTRMLEAASHGVEEELPPLMRPREGNRNLVLVIATNKGLCGALNTNLLRAIFEQFSASSNTSFVAAGNKAKSALARARRNLIADFELAETPKFSDARRIGQFLAGRFLAGDYDRVFIAYTNFVNTITQKPEIAQLLPLAAKHIVKTASLDDAPEHSPDARVGVEHQFEPTASDVFTGLLPLAVNYEIYHAILEAKASEHSARMVAMKNATDNAKTIVKGLTLEFNKVRQAAITAEILEISSAAMAMN